jgi:translation initiation factor eIF-2B subunit epsilon
MSSAAGKDQLVTDDEELLQAIILADSFNNRFKPLTLDKPRVSDVLPGSAPSSDHSQCLLPVCNASLLDWTFESLSLAGVQEVFVVCRAHADLVQTAIR